MHTPDILNTVFIINRCEYLVDAFFESTFPGSKVEDGCVAIIDGMTYDIVQKEPVGIPVQRDLQFYILELNHHEPEQ